MNRWLSGHVFWPLTEGLRQRDTMRRLGELQESQRWSADALRELQNKKLRTIVKLAVEHCPFYAKRFRRLTINPRDPDLNVADLQQFPLLSRSDIRDHLDEMTWHSCPRGGPQPFNTGGSSGEPLKFYIDRYRQAADWAARWRARGWWGVQPGDPEILLWGAPVELAVYDRLRQHRDALLNQWMFNAFDMTDETMEAYTRYIQTKRPVCLYGYSSSLALLSRHAIKQGLSPGGLGSDRLRAVFVTGEVLVDRDRDVIEQAFGAPVVIEYGCRDGGLLACGCKAGRLHIPQENVVIELLDPHGRPVQSGHVGEVVVTNLEARAMPLIRYRTGDLARADATLTDPSAPQCSCGRSSATLIEVRGRLTDQIVCKDGNKLRRMHALSLIYVLREANGLQQFRITQRALDQLDVEIVSDKRFTPVVQQSVERGLRRRMGSDVTIRIHRCERIAPTGSGKHAYVVSHVKP